MEFFTHRSTVDLYHQRVIQSSQDISRQHPDYASGSFPLPFMKKYLAGAPDSIL